MLKYKCTGGFLMLEIILVICVLSIVTSMGISTMKILHVQKKHETTQQNYEIIRCAISAFLSNNNRLPHPAFSLTEGTEQIDISSGYLPYKALGLPKSCAADTEGSAIYYTPHPALTKNFLYIHYDPENEVRIDEDMSFCRIISDNPLRLTKLHDTAVDEHSRLVVAYVLSDKRPVYHDGIYDIEVTGYTSWITRDLLLTKYLKLPPCKCKRTHTHINLTDDDLF